GEDGNRGWAVAGGRTGALPRRNRMRRVPAQRRQRPAHHRDPGPVRQIGNRRVAHLLREREGDLRIVVAVTQRGIEDVNRNPRVRSEERRGGKDGRRGGGRDVGG